MTDKIEDFCDYFSMTDLCTPSSLDGVDRPYHWRKKTWVPDWLWNLVAERDFLDYIRHEFEIRNAEFLRAINELSKENQ